jgi:hypothetical protein
MRVSDPQAARLMDECAAAHHRGYYHRRSVERKSQGLKVASRG